MMDLTGINGYEYSNYINKANEASAEALKNRLSSTSSTESTDEELLDACKQFEAYLWEQVFKEMEKSIKAFSDEEEGDAYASNMVDYFKDTFIQEVSAQATNEGSNSLANILYEQMKRDYSI